ncbi:hypothetical protein O6P43_025622 [Quillaja saponaria]|uniref:FBD domain-containing protein n=1 Tax=Quillaja saponaria TaxID=32244 RepID=A0AAD7PGA4_QUISA|nr:hypothetical protein O6P43_025622 [Quillaja saponaria]
MNLIYHLSNTAEDPVLNYLIGQDCLGPLGCTLKLLYKVDFEAINDSKAELELIKFLLSISPSLEILTYKFSARKQDTDSLFSISQELLRLQRSTRAEITFLREVPEAK